MPNIDSGDKIDNEGPLLNFQGTNGPADALEVSSNRNLISNSNEDLCCISKPTNEINPIDTISTHGRFR